MSKNTTQDKAPSETFSILGAALLDDLSCERHAERAVQHATAIAWSGRAPGNQQALGVIKQALLVLLGERTSVDLDAVRAFLAACESAWIPPANMNPRLVRKLAAKRMSQEARYRLLVRLIEQAVEFYRCGNAAQEEAAFLERLRSTFPGDFDCVSDASGVLEKCTSRAELQRLSPNKRRGRYTPIGAAAALIVQARAWGESSPDDLDSLQKDIDNAVRRATPGRPKKKPSPEAPQRQKKKFGTKGR